MLAGGLPMGAILMTQRAWTSPNPPRVCLDFWTSAYQAIALESNDCGHLTTLEGAAAFASVAAAPGAASCSSSTLTPACAATF